MTCPNKFPTQHSNLRIAVIGECPGKDEEQFGQPFCGASGRFLAALLSRAGVSKEACYLGNVSQYRPINNDVSTLNWSGDEIQEGLYQLGVDMKEFKPNIVILLGNVALKAAKDATTIHPLKPNAFQYKNAKWRGSLFLGNSGGPFDGLKCIATYHPAYCLRDYESTPLLQFDLRKAVREAGTPLLNLPIRQLEVNLPEHIILDRLRSIRDTKTLVALDIEGGIDTMSCISFATSPEQAFIIPINNETTTNIWRALAETLEDAAVPKVLQNALYDRFVLHYSYGIRVCGVVHDTMLKHWELYSELEKSLGVQASIYTDEPYYKFERKADDDDTFFRYCCKDSAVTLEISNKLDAHLRGTSLTHYELNIGLLNPILYMELRGIRYDVAGAKTRRGELLDKLHCAQAELNGMTGHGFCFKKGVIDLKAKAGSLMLKKKVIEPLKPYRESWERFHTLLKEPKPTLATIGELEDLCEVSLNVDSAKQFQHYLYNVLKLPTQMSDIRGKEPTVTSDYEALLKLCRHCLQAGKKDELKILQLAMIVRDIKNRCSDLLSPCDRDGRMRFGFNLVGSNTGRVQCYISPTGNGRAGQGIPNYTDIELAPGRILGDRDLFQSDTGFDLFQCDLKGADGWTYAAYSAMLGDRTMLDDYLFGISPFEVLVLMLEGRSVDFSNRDEIKVACKKYVSKDGWPRFAMKRVQHGRCYLEGDLTVSRNILKDSEGKLYYAPAECGKIGKFFDQRYWGIKKWHDWVTRRLKERPVLVAASGQVRQFFGRPDEILTKAVAFEPQANTTYATNLAMWRLWSDPQNRTGNKLIIEPLHQIHDALVGQFSQSKREWALTKIKSYFNNELTIAGQKIVIPFDGGYGSSWGNLKNKI